MFVRQRCREVTFEPELFTDYSLDELNTALMTNKRKKTASVDGVYPEFIKNSERRTKKWIVFSFSTISRGLVQY
jgi:hypothetical protein